MGADTAGPQITSLEWYYPTKMTHDSYIENMQGRGQIVT
jgi:hypothetical protein